MNAARLLAQVKQWWPWSRSLGNYQYPVARRIGGIPVTPYTAMTYSAVYDCVRIIAETIGILPWNVYEGAPDGSRNLRADHPVYALLHDRPNADSTPMDFKQTILYWLLLWGNAYAEIQYNGGNYPVSLWPIPSDRVAVYKTQENDLEYHVSAASDYYSGSYYAGAGGIIPSNRMLHFRNIAPDGVMGLSIISMAAQSIGSGISMDKFNADYYDKNVFLGGWLEHPGQLKENASRNIEQSFYERFRGIEKSGRFPVLEEGMKLSLVPQFKAQDAQFIESRKFSIQEVCRWFRMPPHKLGDLSDAKYANIEQEQISFTSETLVPWMTRMEQECTYKLLQAPKTSKFFTRMDMNALLRGDLESRYRAYTSGIAGGYLSPNEARAKENMNPIPDGDEYYVPLNLIPQDMVDDYYAPKLAPAPQPNAQPPTGTNPQNAAEKILVRQW